jgi:hypothetical protein
MATLATASGREETAPMGALRVTVGAPEASGGDGGTRIVTAAATLDPPLRGTERCWWSVEEHPALTIGPVADAAVLAAVAPAMAAGLDIEIRGAPVTSGLLAGIDEAQRAWQQWRGWTPVGIDAEEAPAVARSNGALLAFSGGVDSSYTAWRHVSGSAGPQRLHLDAAVFVEGFDVPLRDPAVDRARARIAAPLEQRGVPVVWAATNVRDLHHDWQAFHGFALASVLTFVGGAQRAGLIAATDTYRDPVLGWGSNAVTDPLLGSGSFAIRHDGPVDRVEKLRALAAWPDAIERLRFCWSGTDHAANCGHCLKCATTAMALQVLDLPLTCFGEPPSDATIVAVLRASPTHGFTATYNQPILDEAVARGIDAAWVPALRSRLRKAQYLPALDRLLAPIRRRLPGPSPARNPRDTGR